MSLRIRRPLADVLGRRTPTYVIDPTATPRREPSFTRTEPSFTRPQPARGNGAAPSARGGGAPPEAADPTQTVRSKAAPPPAQGTGRDSARKAGAPAQPDASSPPPPRVAPHAAFTPTQPKAGGRHLIGRVREQTRIVQSLLEDRAHVVLYSERGRGKTSLANWVIESLRRSGVMVGRFTCDAVTTYDDLMRGAVRDLPPSLLTIEAARQSAEEGCGGALPPGPLQARDLVSLPERLDCRRLVLVIDEFDRVRDDATRTRLADTIKQLSDRVVPLQFLILGVSDNLEQILGQHPSTKRAIYGVHLRLFEDGEMVEMLARASHESHVEMPDWVLDRMVKLARGMPHMAQLFGLRVTQAVAERGDRVVNHEDYAEAVERLIEDASPFTHALYAALTKGGADSTMIRLLRQVALAPQDAWGRLPVNETEDGGAEVGGVAIPASAWMPIKAADLLAPAAQSSVLWGFADRALFYHTLLIAEREHTAAFSAARERAFGGAQPRIPMSPTERIAALQRG